MFTHLKSIRHYPNKMLATLLGAILFSSTGFAQLESDEYPSLYMVPSDMLSQISFGADFTFRESPSKYDLPRMSPSFELLLDETVRANLDLSDEDEADLAARIKEIQQLWMSPNGALSQYRQFQNEGAIAEIRKKTRQIEEWLNPKLTKKKLNYLKYLEHRQALLRIGVQNYYNNKTYELKIESHEREEFKKKLAELIRTQHEEGNQIIFDFLNEAAPGFLEPFENDYSSLPKLPIKLITFLIEKEDWCVNVERKALEQYGMLELDGKFSFQPWNFRVGPDAELRPLYTSISIIPMNDFLVRLKGGSLTSEQSSVMLELLMGERDNTSKIENVDRSKIVALPRPGASREEIEKLKAELQKNTDLRNAELLALAQEKNKRLEEILLPHQVREVEVLIRLHNICVFGVKRGVLSYLRSRELEVDHEKLNKSIEALHDDLEKHCLETQTEIESLMLTVTAEDDTIGNLLFNRKSWDFDPELPPMQYELLFYGLIAR